MMKTVRIKMAIIALFVIVGSWSASAQNNRQGLRLRNTTTVVEKPATCTTIQLTDEQKTILNDLSVEFRAAMAELRSALWSASFADKLAIRQQMIDLRNAHIAEVKALLEEWGY
ncbi:MAG: hypothetical protein R2757_10365 [Draconibacterium sp.]